MSIQSRDDKWLHSLLDETWDAHFSDVPQDNVVQVVFGRRARTRLGSIKIHPKDPSITVITMNGLFRDTEIPEFIAKATLVHELCHYAHGFNSPLEQKFEHPHSGGVMRAEFAERGLEQLYLDQKKWLKENWLKVVQKHFGQEYRRRRVIRRIPRPFWT